MNIDLCRRTLSGFAGKRVLVIGDLMLDEHIWGTVERISPEAPVMVVKVDPLREAWQDYRPGGAANVATNIRALGGEAEVVGLVGDDEGRRLLLGSLESAGVDVGGVVVDPDLPTIRKTRIWASHRQQVIRIDRESKRVTAPSVFKRLVRHIEQAAERADAILLSDYDKGIFTAEVIQVAIGCAESRGIVSISNPKPRNLGQFAGVGVATLNQSEAAAASGLDIASEPDVERAGRAILGRVRCGGLVITRGAHGLSVFEGAGGARHIPAIESEVYDVAGAGDTVVSALTLSLACGLDLAHAGAIANCAGGAVVRRVGVVTTCVEEIDRLLAEWSASARIA